jgi:DNA polymerase beta
VAAVGLRALIFAQSPLCSAGTKIGEKIDELLSTGSLARLERDRNDAGTTALRELQRVSGIGRKFAERLIEVHKITSLPALLEASERDSSLLSREQKLGLCHLSDFESRIPRDEISVLETFVRAAADAHKPPLTVTVCGSYRRGKPDSGDIDCLLCHPSFNSERNGTSFPTWMGALVRALQASGFVTDIISQGLKKCAAVCRLPAANNAGSVQRYRRLDLRLVPYESYFYSTLYFTGSDEHNKQMRNVAIGKGLKLSEYGLFPMVNAQEVGESAPAADEAAIFAHLGMPYKTPLERDV